MRVKLSIISQQVKKANDALLNKLGEERRFHLIYSRS